MILRFLLLANMAWIVYASITFSRQLILIQWSVASRQKAFVEQNAAVIHLFAGSPSGEDALAGAVLVFVGVP